MLIIDPDECIDCAVCIPECPVNAIYADVDLPQDQLKFVEINAELAKTFTTITDKKEAPPDAEQWKDVKDKLQYLER
jgi:ferredoxin